MRSLLNPSQRIISNVSPSIPYEYIENILKKNNIKMTSKMTFIRTDIQDAGFNHVMSL